ncbi:putative BOI-related E3 ubiquitin-protein ligase 1 [Iris pallida]|uniref:BOI-related E3 ubiquitin-protein ligase 1 n=1 Tax=Iris pallida TaxID=29817 RepID=A0AAX6EK18_IRIPA|nr:putative BOI-related E3 ubiquitin-protein ligase 1 [Iris pallida]
MAVEAQYPSNLVFLNRTSSEKENKRKKEEEVLVVVDYYNHQQHQPPLFFSTNGEPSHGGRDDNNPRARGRDSRTHLRPPPSVSTGLRLSSRDLSAHTHQELDHFLLAQGEQLRRTLAEKRQQHYRALLAAAEESAARRMREKQAELDRAAQGTAELEARLARIRTESTAWQAKAVADQAAAASLHARLQRASSAPVRTVGPKPDERGESPAAEDAESACAEPFRSGFCRSCRVSPVSVVLLPCRHLCLCAGCDAVTAGECCPVCGSARTGSVPVFL